MSTTIDPSLEPSAFRRFMDSEAAPGIVLVVAAVVALIWINSPLSDSYVSLWNHEFTVNLGFLRITEPLRLWVNDLLMALFFFVAGLEIKHALVHGELRQFRAAMLPIGCAVGGMVVPALIFTAFNAGKPGGHGWGIPMATDIAFSLGVLALALPRRVRALKVFLLTLAIVDDVGAILVIAVFYSSGVDFRWLAGAMAVVLVIVVLQRLGVRSILPYVALAPVLWLAMFESGVHATLAGVILGLLTPARKDFDPNRPPPLERLVTRLGPWSSFLVLPLFALANAGIEIAAASLKSLWSSPISGGVAAGLVIGKPVGVMITAVVLVKFVGAALPEGVAWSDLVGVGLLAGIGFTVSLFVTDLALVEPRASQARLAIIAASIIAGVAGSVVLRRSARRRERRQVGAGQPAL